MESASLVSFSNLFLFMILLRILVARVLGGHDSHGGEAGFTLIDGWCWEHWVVHAFQVNFCLLLCVLSCLLFSLFLTFKLAVVLQAWQVLSSRCRHLILRADHHLAYLIISKLVWLGHRLLAISV
jgi:hypothetical protein